ncbi:hypothetical protein BDW22DRAFT_1349197 [Trametopsis cervina]|nr:hypothetical protein BDW22DRAFT_1349197 [Trametopsis cervina]
MARMLQSVSRRAQMASFVASAARSPSPSVVASAHAQRRRRRQRCTGSVITDAHVFEFVDWTMQNRKMISWKRARWIMIPAPTTRLRAGQSAPCTLCSNEVTLQHRGGLPMQHAEMEPASESSANPDGRDSPTAISSTLNLALLLLPTDLKARGERSLLAYAHDQLGNELGMQ